MSKITVAGVRSNVAELLDYSLETKKRNFLETVELQIGLKVSPPPTFAPTTAPVDHKEDDLLTRAPVTTEL